MRSACYPWHRIRIPHLCHVLSRSIVAEILCKAEHPVHDSPLRCGMCGLTLIGYKLQNINTVWDNTPFLLRRINVHRKSSLETDTLSIDFKLSKHLLRLWCSERFCWSPHTSITATHVVYSLSDYVRTYTSKRREIHDCLPYERSGEVLCKKHSLSVKWPGSN